MRVFSHGTRARLPFAIVEYYLSRYGGRSTSLFERAAELATSTSVRLPTGETCTEFNGTGKGIVVRYDPGGDKTCLYVATTDERYRFEDNRLWRLEIAGPDSKEVGCPAPKRFVTGLPLVAHGDGVPEDIITSSIVTEIVPVRETQVRRRLPLLDADPPPLVAQYDLDRYTAFAAKSPPAVDVQIAFDPDGRLVHVAQRAGDCISPALFASTTGSESVFMVDAEGNRLVLRKGKTAGVFNTDDGPLTSEVFDGGEVWLTPIEIGPTPTTILIGDGRNVTINGVTRLETSPVMLRLTEAAMAEIAGPKDRRRTSRLHDSSELVDRFMPQELVADDINALLVGASAGSATVSDFGASADVARVREIDLQ